MAPLAVFADTDIFAHAPRRLTASGVSDLLGKYICLADWKIASLLTGEYICSEIIEMEEKALKTVCSCVKGIASGEPEDCEKADVCTDPFRPCHADGGKFQTCFLCGTSSFPPLGDGSGKRTSGRPSRRKKFLLELFLY